VGDDALDLLAGTGRTVDVGAPELGHQQVPATENVQRQVAVAIIVAMKEPTLLVPVDRIIGGIKIKDNPLGRLCVGLQEQIDEQILDGGCVMADLVITARRTFGRVFQAVQCGLAGQGRTVRTLGLQAVCQQAKHRIVPQFIMIVDVLIAQRDPGNALADHGRQTMHHLIGIAMIAET
jgi:hypothetical protein